MLSAKGVCFKDICTIILKPNMKMAWRLLSPNVYIFYKYSPVRKCKKYFDLRFCVIVFPQISCSGRIKQLITAKHKHVVCSCRFSLWKPANFPSAFAFCPSGKLFRWQRSIQMHGEMILKNSGSLRRVVWLTDTFTSKGHLSSWFICSVNVVVLQPCHPIIASAALLFYVVS